MSAAPKLKLTSEQYLAIERAAPFKSEFYRGEMYAMAGARYLHNRVLANLIALVHLKLQGSPCFVLPNDMRVKSSKNQSYFYPDVIIVCGKPQFEDSLIDTLVNPKVIFEVLSPSTERFDRGDKFDEYRNIPSMEEYVLVSQDRIQIQRFTRQSQDHWDMRIFKDESEEFHLQTVKVAIHMKEIYAGVEFGPEEERKVDLTQPR